VPCHHASGAAAALGAVSGGARPTRKRTNALRSRPRRRTTGTLARPASDGIGPPANEAVMPTVLIRGCLLSGYRAGGRGARGRMMVEVHGKRTRRCAGGRRTVTEVLVRRLRSAREVGGLESPGLANVGHSTSRGGRFSGTRWRQGRGPVPVHLGIGATEKNAAARFLERKGRCGCWAAAGKPRRRSLSLGGAGTGFLVVELPAGPVRYGPGPPDGPPFPARSTRGKRRSADRRDRKRGPGRT